MWRVVMSKRVTVSLAEIETAWSIDDLADANDLLDCYDIAESKAMREHGA